MGDNYHDITFTVSDQLHCRVCSFPVSIPKKYTLIALHEIPTVICQTPSKRRTNGQTDKQTRIFVFLQLSAKIINITGTRSHILRLKCTKFDSRHLSVRPSVCVLVEFDNMLQSHKLPYISAD